MRKNPLPTPETVIAEARSLASFLVETERGKCGGDVDLAIHHAAALWGIEEGAVRSLRYRWREMHDVKASLLERLREAYETIYERQRRVAAVERDIDDIISRGGAGGAQAGDVHTEHTPAPCPTPRAILSRADDMPAKRHLVDGAELQLEKEH